MLSYMKISKMRYCILILLISIMTEIQCYMICEYKGDNNLRAQHLKDTECDVLVNFNGKITANGFQTLNTIKPATETLRVFNCDRSCTPLFFGVNLCPDDVKIDPAYVDRYVSSAEMAVKWAKMSEYDGVYIDLCTVEGYLEDTINRILYKVQSSASENRLDYGFGLIGNGTGFTLTPHIPTASFIAVAFKELRALKNSWSDYNSAVNVTAVADFWNARAANMSQMVFRLQTLTVVSTDHLGVFIMEPISACADGNRVKVVDYMWQNLTKIAEDINNFKMKGVFLRTMEWDDFVGTWCYNGTSPFTRAIRTKLNDTRIKH